MNNVKQFHNMRRLCALALFYSVLFSACAGLGTTVAGIPIYLPYIVTIAAASFVLCAVPISSRTLNFSTFEKLYLTVPFLMLLASFASVSPTDSLIGTIVYLYGLALFLIIKVLLVSGLLNIRDCEKVALAIFILLTIVAIAEYLTNLPLGVVTLYFGDDASRYNMLDREWKIVTLDVSRHRVSGTFRNPIAFSIFYTLFFSIAFTTFITATKSRTLFSFFTIMFLSVIAGWVVFASKSLSGLIYYTVLIALIFLIKIRQKGRPLIVFGVMISLIIMLFGGLAKTDFRTGKYLQTFEQLLKGEKVGNKWVLNNIHARSDGYIGAVRLLKNPSVFFSGVGTGQFREGLQAYDIRDVEGRSAHLRRLRVHNWFLSLLVENGVLITFIYAGSILGILLFAVKGSMIGSNPHALGISLGLLVMYCTAFQFTTVGSSVWGLTFVNALLPFTLIRSSGLKPVNE